MRLNVFLFCLAGLIIFPLAVFSQEGFTFDEVLSLGLPVVNVSTIDEEEPTADKVSCPPGAMGAGITNATKVPGAVTVYSPDGTVAYESGDYVAKESGMTIKVRGNTSAYSDKKAFKIKLQKKGDMLGRGDKKFNDKNWVLIRSYSLRTYFGNKICEFAAQPWTPAGIHVNLIVNGDYRGLYYLQESVERNVNCRIDVQDDGFVMEHDPYWWNENGEYLESCDHPRYSYTFKYPDFEDATEEQLTSIHNALKKYESSIDDGTYPDIIDVESFANWILCHDILGTGDGGGVNWYLTKNSLSDDSKIMCGPLWDFDSSEITTESFSRIHLGRFDKLFKNTNNAFRKAYVKRWNELKGSIFNKIDSIIDDLKTPEWDAYSRSVSADRKRWDGYEEPLMTSYYRFKKYYGNRFVWMEKTIREMEEVLFEEYLSELGLPYIMVTTEAGFSPEVEFAYAPEGYYGVKCKAAPIVLKEFNAYSPEGELLKTFGDRDLSMEIHPDMTDEDASAPWTLNIRKKQAPEVENPEETDAQTNETEETEDDVRNISLELLSVRELKTMLYSTVASILFDEIKPFDKFVNFFIDKTHYGIYHPTLDQTLPQVDTANGGFIVKEDHRWWAEDENYLTSLCGLHNFTFVEPSFENLDETDIEYLVGSWENAVRSGISANTDITSFAKWMLLQDITGTGYETDRYIYAIDGTSPIRCLPYIKANSSETVFDRWSVSHEILWSTIRTNRTDLGKKFTKAYISAWEEYGPAVFSVIQEVLNAFINAKAPLYDQSIASINSNKRTADYILRAPALTPAEEAVNRASQWYDDRKVWMSENVDRLNDIETRVVGISSDTPLSITGNSLQTEEKTIHLKIAAIDGAILFNGSMAKGESFILPSGCWIISADSKSYKVIL